MSNVFKMIIGNKYNRLTAIEPTNQRIDGKIVWRYLCECGKEHVTAGRDVARGNTKSCGCLQKEMSLKRSTTHGAKRNGKTLRSYSIWCGMKTRCKSGYEKSHRYFDRGIIVCDRWLSYENFIQDMGEPPEGTSLDRINNNGNYEPGNCRWADDLTQSANKGRKTETYILIDTDYLF